MNRKLTEKTSEKTLKKIFDANDYSIEQRFIDCLMDYVQEDFGCILDNSQDYRYGIFDGIYVEYPVENDYKLHEWIKAFKNTYLYSNNSDLINSALKQWDKWIEKQKESDWHKLCDLCDSLKDLLEKKIRNNFSYGHSDVYNYFIDTIDNYYGKEYDTSNYCFMQKTKWIYGY